MGRTSLDVKALRRKLGKSQTELAAAVPVSDRQVRRWEQKVSTPSQMAVARLRQLEADHEERMGSKPVRERKRLVKDDGEKPQRSAQTMAGVLPSSF